MINVKPPLFSVVVPVYNTPELLLRRCLDSITRQSFTSFEALIVDDGSTDNCAAICDKYAKNDSRFRIFHQANSGVSTARNKGIDEACGLWVTFADSDDWFEDDAFTALANRLETLTDCDMLWFNTKSFTDTDSQTWHVLDIPDGSHLTEAQKRLVLLDFVAEGFETRRIPHGFLSAVSKVFRREFLNNHPFRFHEDMTIAEDMTFNTEVVYALPAERICYFDAPLYCRYHNQTSATHSYHPNITANDQHFLSHLTKAVGELANEPDFKRAFVKRYLICLLGVSGYDMIHPDNPKPRKQRHAELASFISQEPYATGLRKCRLSWLSKRNKVYTLLLRMHLYGAYEALHRR